MKTQISQQNMRGSMLFSCTIPILGCAHVGIQKQNGDTMNSYNAQHVSFPRDALPRHNSNGSPRRIKSCDCREDSDRGGHMGPPHGQGLLKCPHSQPQWGSGENLLSSIAMWIWSNVFKCGYVEKHPNFATMTIIKESDINFPQEIPTSIFVRQMCAYRTSSCR